MFAISGLYPTYAKRARTEHKIRDEARLRDDETKINTSFRKLRSRVKKKNIQGRTLVDAFATRSEKKKKKKVIAIYFYFIHPPPRRNSFDKRKET